MNEAETSISWIQDGFNSVRIAPQFRSFETLLIGFTIVNTAIFIYESMEGRFDPQVIGNIFVSLIGAGVADKFSREQVTEYKKIKDKLETNGWNERLIEPKTHSWCQRRNARLAAIDLGYKNEVNEYYDRKGYRWYHILPDVKNNSLG